MARPSLKPISPSAYWGEEKIWSQRANNHNGMFDKKGRVWLAAAVRGIENPAFCKKGSDHPSAKAFPLERSGRQVTMLDPKTHEYSFIDTCFGTHHPQFGYDADDTLWVSGTGPVAGWVNTKLWDETGDAVKAQGWAPFVLDTNGNGKVDEYTEPGEPAEADKDMRIAGSGPYAVMPHPTDGSVWYTVNVFAGTARLHALRSEDQTVGILCHSEGRHRRARRRHRQERRALGLGLERQPDQLRPQQMQEPAERAERDRQPLPGRLCLLQISGPGLRRASRTRAPRRATTPGSTSTTRSALARTSRSPPPTSTTASSRFKDGQMVMLRIPYPLGFFAKGLDGRIDDPNAGWKGRGLWSTSGDRTPWLMEGGKGSKPRAVHIQVRPDPLAK